MRFRDTTVLVTGATGGLGRAICRAFAAEGARVIAADLPGAPAAALAAELGGGAAPRVLDVTDEAQWQAAFAAHPIDVLVNNAGFFQPNVPFEDMSLDLWRRHFAVNADGVFLGCQHAIRTMPPGGAVVNIGSGMSIKANPAAAAYCGSKAAVLMTTRTAAAAAGPRGIRVNAVLPGAVDTAMLMGNLLEGEEPGAYLEKMASHSTLGRLAGADDIARATLFLADPASGAITGVYLPVDGGNLLGA